MNGRTAEVGGVRTDWYVEASPGVLLLGRSGDAFPGLQRLLEARGCSVTCTTTASPGQPAKGMDPQLIIVSAPRLLDLLDLCRKAFSTWEAPILALGQRNGKEAPIAAHEQHDWEEDEVLCLEYGADVYLPPDISSLRLQAHVSALLRRGSVTQRATVLTFGDISIDVRRRRVYRSGREIILTQREYTLLRVLSENPGQDMSRQALTDIVSSTTIDGDSRSIDVHIHRLREKLGMDRGKRPNIRTIWGIGYSFELE